MSAMSPEELSMILVGFGENNLAAAFEAYPASCMVDQHLTHGAGRESEKVRAVKRLRRRTRDDSLR